MKGGAALKNKIFILAALAALIAVLFCGCSEGEKIEEEQNPEEFSYDMLDLSLVANEIYGKLEISELTRKSIDVITDETMISEQFYLNIENHWYKFNIDINIWRKCNGNRNRYEKCRNNNVKWIYNDSCYNKNKCGRNFKR